MDDSGTPKDKDEVNRRDGENCLLLIDKARTKDKTYKYIVVYYESMK
jgi:hypothetical protein